MKSVNNMAILCSSLLLTNLLVASETLYDESLEDILKTDSELKVDIGSREGARNFLDSRMPVDVVTYKQIENSGSTTLTEALRYFVPGFNAASTSVADGSDHVQSYTLRGMRSDQILVLINGKRVHTSALLRVNRTVGYGSSHVDLDTIALASIERVEILRDGAAAQYGSDAISGVINIILKGAGHKSSVSVHAGQRQEGDGTKLYAETFIAIPLKNDGFVNVTMSAISQEETQRAGADRRVDLPEVQTHAGIPESKNYHAVLNAEVLEIDDVILYSNVIFNYRDSEASAFFRPYNEDNGIYPQSAKERYPNGFLPMINAKILDYAMSIGVKGEFSGIEWDLSNVYGVNDFNFNVFDSMNYDLGLASPSSFDNGSLISTQNTTNLDLRKRLDQFDLAGGLEYRYERYEIEAGDNASYTDSGYSQGFAGYRTENEVDSDRNSYAVYLNGTYHFTKDLSLEAAGRYEDYSDFGSTTNFKLALGYKVAPKLFLRSSGSTGFRAPSLAQSNYSHTSSFGSANADISTQGIFRVNHEVAKSLGAQDLEAETSKHFTLGGVYQPSKEISFMVDYFYTDVKDKIMLSSSMSASTPEQQAVFDAYGVSAANFFTNAVDTKTEGIDLKFNYHLLLTNDGILDLGIWYSYNNNKITAFNDGTITEENSYKEIDRIKNGQPKDSVRILTNYKVDAWNVMMNLSRYGSYQQVILNQAYTFESAWTTDLDISYQVNDSIKIAIGGTNIFDIIPNKWDDLSGIGYGYDGILPYSNYSPFGYSGAYYYLKATIKF